MPTVKDLQVGQHVRYDVDDEHGFAHITDIRDMGGWYIVELDDENGNYVRVNENEDISKMFEITPE